LEKPKSEETLATAVAPIYAAVASFPMTGMVLSSRDAAATALAGADMGPLNSSCPECWNNQLSVQ